jgi:hypothetical protein
MEGPPRDPNQPPDSEGQEGPQSPQEPGPAQQPQPQPQSPAGAQQPPAHGQPPPGQGAQQPAPGQPWEQQPGWAPPAYAPPAEPGNGQAIAAFILGLISLVMLAFTLGFFFFVSLPCAIVAIFLGRIGRRRVDEGETPKHRGLAQAGFVTGIVGTVLSVLATVGWILVFVLAAGSSTSSTGFG